MLSRTWATWASVIVVLSLLASGVLAEPAAISADGPEERLAFETLARAAQSVTDAVLAQHVDPPTRQEMWLEGTKAMLAKVGILDHAGLSAEISQLTSPQQLAAFLNDLRAKQGLLQNQKSASAQQQAFIDGMLGIIPGGATFVSRKELAVQQQFQANRYIGTGIALGYDADKKYPWIANVIPGGPMQRAGGRVKDLIFKIDDRAANGLDIVETTDLLRGPEGTSVTLVVGAAPDERRTIVVTRGPVVLETLQGLHQADDGKWDYRVESHLPICYIKVVRINGSTVHDLRKLERQFRTEAVQAVILDLCSSFAQDLHHTLLLADALLDGGVIGRVRTGRHVHEYRADRECLFRDWPLAVLVDQDTRGGAEWIVAALQDNHAAVIVGERTAGIAHVRTFVELHANGGAVEMNTAIFERPSGISLANAMNLPHARTRPKRRRIDDGDDDPPTGGVIPDLPKPRERIPGSERPFGESQRPAPGGPQVTRSQEEDSGGELRWPIPRGLQAARLDHGGILRMALLELKARLDASEGRNRR